MAANTPIPGPSTFVPTVASWLADMNARFAPNRYGNIDDEDFRVVFESLAEVFTDWRSLNVRRVRGATYPVPYTDNLNLIPADYRIVGMQAVAVNGVDSSTGTAGVTALPVYFTLLRNTAGTVPALVDGEPGTELTVRAAWVRTSGSEADKIASFPVFVEEDHSYDAGDVFQFTFAGGVTRLFEVRHDLNLFQNPLPTGLDSDPNYQPFAPLNTGQTGSGELVGDNERLSLFKRVKCDTTANPQYYAGNSTLTDLLLKPELFCLGTQIKQVFPPVTYIIDFDDRTEPEMLVHQDATSESNLVGGKLLVLDSPEALTANIPVWSATFNATGTPPGYPLGFVIRATFNGIEGFHKALQVGQLPAPTSAAGDAIWRPIAGPQPSTGLITLTRQQAVYAQRDGEVQPGRRYRLLGGAGQGRDVLVDGTDPENFAPEGLLVLPARQSGSQTLPAEFIPARVLPRFSYAEPLAYEVITRTDLVNRLDDAAGQLIGLDLAKVYAIPISASTFVYCRFATPTSRSCETATRSDAAGIWRFNLANGQLTRLETAPVPAITACDYNGLVKYQGADFNSAASAAGVYGHLVVEAPAGLLLAADCLLPGHLTVDVRGYYVNLGGHTLTLRGGNEIIGGGNFSNGFIASAYTGRTDYQYTPPVIRGGTLAGATLRVPAGTLLVIDDVKVDDYINGGTRWVEGLGKLRIYNEYQVPGQNRPVDPATVIERPLLTTAMFAANLVGTGSPAGTLLEQLQWLASRGGGGSGSTAPSITGAAPNSAATGATVMLYGANLSNPTEFLLGPTAITAYAVNQAGTAISFTVPPGASTGFISITTASGTATSTGVFTVTTSGRLFADSVLERDNTNGNVQDTVPQLAGRSVVTVFSVCDKDPSAEGLHMLAGLLSPDGATMTDIAYFGSAFYANTPYPSRHGISYNTYTSATYTVDQATDALANQALALVETTLFNGTTPGAGELGEIRVNGVAQTLLKFNPGMQADRAFNGVFVTGGGRDASYDWPGYVKNFLFFGNLSDTRRAEIRAVLRQQFPALPQ